MTRRVAATKLHIFLWIHKKRLGNLVLEANNSVFLNRVLIVENAFNKITYSSKIWQRYRKISAISTPPCTNVSQMENIAKNANKHPFIGQSEICLNIANGGTKTDK